ncbi:hypothetical protein Tco_0454013 [Tanacetum coccineum]
MESQSETTQTVSALKLPEVIVNGDSVSPVASASTGAEGPISPKIAEQKLAMKNELKAKSTLMLAIPDEHLLKFHACKDAKSLWEAIKNRFGGNKESNNLPLRETLDLRKFFCLDMDVIFELLEIINQV